MHGHTLAFQQAYADGFRNGRLDALLGLRLEIALHSNIPGYSEGYHDGQLAARQLPDAPGTDGDPFAYSR